MRNLTIKRIMENIPRAELDQIVFGIFSSEEIKKLSVCNVSSTKIQGENSVYDERMGSLDNNSTCKSCSLTCKLCIGHPGHIELFHPILHPMYYRYIVNILKCICFNCNRFLLNAECLELLSISSKLRGEIKLNRILEKVEKTDSCLHCKQQKFKISFSVLDSILYKYVDKKKVVIKEEEIKDIFDTIPDEDVKLLGFDTELIHPRNLVINVLPVLPPISRPYIVSEGSLYDDDLTKQYSEIVKINKHLMTPCLTSVRKEKYVQMLKFRIKTLMNNSQSKSRHSNGRPLKGIKERLTGKDGLIRNNLMGKRCNQTARTVIGPDPTVRTDELVVPEKIAKILTVPERVTDRNIGMLTDLVNADKANFILRGKNEEIRINLKYAMYKKQTEIIYGDKVFRNDVYVDSNTKGFFLKEGDYILRNGEKITDLSFPVRKDLRLQIGDIVERQLRNGDIVLLNRQPTLHKSSMLAKKVVIRPYKTFRFNLASCKSFNADFDGDEMNIHVPQQADTITELIELSATKKNIVGPQGSKTNLCIVQDSLLGSYLMTKSCEIMPKERFYQICMRGDKWTVSYIMKKIDYIRNVLVELNKDPDMVYTGKGLFSMMFPNDFVYVRKNDVSKKEPIVRIYKGVLYEGVLNKSNLGSAHNSLLQVLLKDYNEDICIDFINNVQFVTSEWLLYEGFSVGMEDCITDKQEEVKQNVIKSYFEAKKIESSTSHPKIKEARILSVLNKAKDVGMKISKDNMAENNSFISTVMSGSKGDFFNIAQITGLVGQQNITGKRVQATFNKSKRTLPHYRYDMSDDIVSDFESKGFIRHSFMQGLNPKEFWFHAMSGREGVSDTAMKSVTGDTPIVILENNVMKYVKIGDWIDNLLQTNVKKVQHLEDRQMELYELQIDKTYIPTTDCDGNVTWGIIQNVTRHDPGDMLYKIQTASGRSVIVTESHSLLILGDDGKFFKRHANEVKVGDLVPVTMELSKPTNKMAFEKEFLFTHENGMFLGLFLSQGHIEDDKIFIYYNSCKIDTWLIEWFKDNKVKYLCEKQYITFTSSSFASILSNIGGKTKKERFINPECFDSPSYFVHGILTTLYFKRTMDFDGDRHITTSSTRFANDVAMLLSRIGVFGRTVSNQDETTIVVVMQEHIHKTLNNVVCDAIISINKVEPKETYKKVYDLTIPSTLNFCLANGLHVVDTSLSGYVQRKMVKVMEDVQIRYDGTVRNSQGSVIQWTYGDDGFDRTSTVLNNNNEMDFCNVDRIVDRINVNYESVLIEKVK